MKKKTTEQFIWEAKQVHGDKYDYTKTKYIDSNTKVIIVCPKHGEFQQHIHAHKSGAGCSKCNGGVKYDTKTWIKKARNVHDNRFDYSKVKYVNANIKVIIICPEHGEFKQKASDHLSSKQCCPQCVLRYREGGFNIISNIEFIEKLKNKFGDIWYDYSKVNYRGTRHNVTIKCKHGEFEKSPNMIYYKNNHICNKCSSEERYLKKIKKLWENKFDLSKINFIDRETPVTIICPDHGEFQIKPLYAIKGSGYLCKKCSFSNRKGKFKKRTTKEFIFEAVKIHGDMFDYSKANYINSQTNLTIICPKHGEFQQTPIYHLNGKGCAKCAGNYVYNIKDFLEKSFINHGDYYDYSKVEFEIFSRDVVTIICPKHGEFQQRAIEHASGKGCAKCAGVFYGNYLSYQKAKEFLKQFGFKNIKEYFAWWDKYKPEFLPKNFHQHYTKNAKKDNN